MYIKRPYVTLYVWQQKCTVNELECKGPKKNKSNKINAAMMQEYPIP